jgi:hypothetical protein
MGIYIDWWLRAEGTDDEIRARLERVRQRCLDLPLRQVGEVLHVDPACTGVAVAMYSKQGYELPPAVEARYRPVAEDRSHRMRSFFVAPISEEKLPDRDLRRYFAPALALIERGELWNPEELPEEVKESSSLGRSSITINRRGIELDFASLLLRHGYLLTIEPGDGCETMQIGLSTFRQPPGRRARKPPLWCGSGSIKTQYAKSYIQVHETACRVLDLIREEGMLLEAGDNCGYYESRSWKEASKRVNEELIFARIGSGIIDVMVGNLREEGVQVKDVVNNAAKATPVDFSAALAREAAEKQAEKHG